MKTLTQALEEKATGLHYGNRIILPFHVELLKVSVKNDIVTDFNTHNEFGAAVHYKENYMEIYFHDYKDIFEYVSEFKAIKMVVVEEGKDIFDFKNHQLIDLRLSEKHVVQIEKIDGDVVFID